MVSSFVHKFARADFSAGSALQNYICLLVRHHLGGRDCFNLTYASCQRHDRRLDKLAKDLTQLSLALSSPDFRMMSLGMKAYAKLLQRLNLKVRSRTRRFLAAEALKHGNVNVGWTEPVAVIRTK